MYRRVQILGLIVVLIGVGLYGVFRPGPGAGETPDAVAVKLGNVPRKIGPWAGVDRGVRANALRVAEAEAHLSREYTNEATGEVVNVLVLYGEPGALGAHTPDVCYAGAGFDPCGEVTRLTLPEYETGGPAELWCGRFERKSGRDPARAEAIEVTWGWGAGGAWHAAENPRFTFADRRMIYKLYAQRPVRGDYPPSPAAPDPTTTAFLTRFLRALNATVAGP